MSAIPLGGASYLQSHYLLLQAAGSDGSDETAPGIHLRWDLLNQLGHEHIPKGNLSTEDDYQTTIGFNKANDFVKIYRAPYDGDFPVEVNFSSAPTAINEGFAGYREWRYENLEPYPADTQLRTHIIIRFRDIDTYDTLRDQIDPATNPLQFMTAYSGTIEVEAENKLSFAGAIHRGTGGEVPRILMETISKGEPFDADPLIISSRSELTFDGEGEAQVICENIKYFRFTKNSQPIQKIVVETYEDFVRGTNAHPSNAWSEVGPSTGFGLSINQTEIQTRLEDSSRFTVNQEWPKFNGGDAMLVSNYTDRWFSPGGVRDGVIEYLVASVDDVRAVKQYASDNPDSDLGIALSLLDGLKMVALDYHNARMLGLAYIDTDIDPDLPGQRYIYLAEYFTHDGLEKVPPNQATIQHLYCSIPTHLQNYRLPKNPVLNPLGYGLQINTVSGEWVTISDDEGYAPNGDARFVNLHAAKEDLFEPFKLGVGGEVFNMCDYTEPIFHGVEYREEGQVAWQSQELSYDPNYNGYNAGTPGLNEVVPIANKDNPVFTHRETQEGTHEYGLYSINWFSRVSGLSNVRATSETAFPISKSLLPPANLAAHYIQEEHPIVLSTEAEQDALADRKQSNPTGDNYETRALFYWNQVHNINYAFADTVEFLFRLEAPLNVRGEIRSATTNPSDPALIDIETQSIEMASRGLDGSGQIPKVDPDFNGQSGRFIGGNLVCDGRSYTILAIDDTGTFPVITIQPLRDYEAIHTEHNRFSPIVNQLKPDAGSRFEATENLSDMDNWTVLQKDVALIHQSQHSETKVLDGKQVTQVMGGVYDWASIEPVPDVYDIDDQGNGDIPPGSQIGDPIPGSKSGIFKVDFHSYVLDDHPDPEVSWYRGTVRVLRDGYPDKKMIEVVKIESYTTEIYEGVIQVPEADTGDHKLLRSVKTEQYDSGQLQIYVEDPDHETSPIDTGTGKSITYLAGTSQASADQMATDGQADTATIEAIPKVYTHHDDIPADSEVGDPIPGTTSGLYRIGFDTHTYQQHPSTQASVLRLYVYDPDFDNDPILTGASLPVNFHPGYRLYLEAETAQGDIFNKENIQPTGSERLKKTWFSTRAKDSSTQVFSTPARPVPLLGRKVVPPEPPAEPSGPLYATRPDYYGKASYTFDVQVNVDAQREPYALQFLKANEEAILFALYTKATRDSIRAALPKPKDDTFFTQRWYDLVNVILENNQFKTYAGDPTGFNFPNPDNPDYYYLSNPMDPASKVYPFDGAPDPGTIEGVVREAIISAFVPLTEQLVVYEQISDADRQTSPSDPVIQDDYGDSLPVTNPAYNPFPMVRKFADNGEHFVRITDYRLDGAAQNWYFYLAREVSDSMELSEDSPVAGPIQLVNTRPPAAPKVQQLNGLRAPVERKGKGLKWLFGPSEVRKALRNAIVGPAYFETVISPIFIREIHNYIGSSYISARKARTYLLARADENAVGDNPSPYVLTQMVDQQDPSYFDNIDFGQVLYGFEALVAVPAGESNPRTGRGYHDYGKVPNDPNRPGLVDPYDLASIIANIATPVVEYMLHDEDVPKSGGFFAPPTADLLEYYEISAPDADLFGNVDALGIRNAYLNLTANNNPGLKLSDVLQLYYEVPYTSGLDLTTIVKEFYTYKTRWIGFATDPDWGLAVWQSGNTYKWMPDDPSNMVTLDAIKIKMETFSEFWYNVLIKPEATIARISRNWIDASELAGGVRKIQNTAQRDQNIGDVLFNIFFPWVKQKVLDENPSITLI